MKNGTERMSAFERLKKGLEEGIAFTRGELTLRTTVVVVGRPPKVSANAIRRLRKSLKLSQTAFAQMLNVSARTVQSWEQGERKPSQAALRLLQILEARPNIVHEVLGIPSTAVG